MSLEVAFETGRLYKPLRDLADAKRDIYTSFLLLPGLRSFWPMSAINANGDALDLAQGSGYHLFTSGQPVYNLSGYMPYVQFDGDYLYHSDTNVYDITGTEAHIDPSIRGLTVGGWFWLNAAGSATNRALVTKDAVSIERSYTLFVKNTNEPRFIAFQDASTNDGVSGSIITHNTWLFIVGRFEPSSNVSVIVNGHKTSLPTTISALMNSSALLMVGNDGGVGKYLNGRASLCFLCAAALPDSLIDNLFRLTRDQFGV